MKYVSMNLECGGGSLFSKGFHVCVKNPKHASKISIKEYYRDDFISAYHICFPYDTDVYIFTDEYTEGQQDDTASLEISHYQNGKEEKILDYSAYLCDSEDYEEYQSMKRFYHEQLRLIHEV